MILYVYEIYVVDDVVIVIIFVSWLKEIFVLEGK